MAQLRHLRRRDPVRPEMAEIGPCLAPGRDTRPAAKKASAKGRTVRSPRAPLASAWESRGFLAPRMAGGPASPAASEAPSPIGSTDVSSVSRKSGGSTAAILASALRAASAKTVPVRSATRREPNTTASICSAAASRRQHEAGIEYIAGAGLALDRPALRPERVDVAVECA